MKIAIYNQEGKEIEKISLPEEIFNVKISPDLVYQVVVSQMANQRKTIAHTKDRGEVSGGGKKPWRQKGTGRARHGSIRSPLWKGGGVTFGPRKEKVFKKRIPKKMKRKALFMVLSEKARNNFLIVLDELNLGEAKTKFLAKLIENWKLKFAEDSLHLTPHSALPNSAIEDFKGGSLLIALPKMDKSLILAARNLHNVKTIQAKDLNTLDLLSFKYLIMPKDSIEVIKESFLK